MGLGDRSLPGGYKQVAIPVFVNRTQEIGIEVPFTNALIREFETSKIAEVVPMAAAAVRLEGHIESIHYLPRSAAQGGSGQGEIGALPDDTVLTTSYQIIVETKLRLRRNSDQAVLWEGSVSNERVYSAPRIGSAVVNSANVLYNQSARHLNITALAGEMMEEAHDRMTENF